MSDYYLQKFWKDVKDSSWPELYTSEDFAKIDQHFIDECFDQHNLAQRLKEIEDPQYWSIYSLGEFFIKDEFVFINIPKCGSRHYYNFFIKQLNWKRYYPKSFDELKGLVKFGLMMHPLDRYLKGLTEFVWQLNLKDTIDLKKLSETSFIPDIHSTPYHLMLGDLIEDIHWVPFKLFKDQEVKSYMNNMFARYESSIRVPIDYPPIHVSSPEKKDIHKKNNPILA